MREIKFRAWNTETKQMIVQSPWDSFHKFHITPFGNIYKEGKLQPLILLQFTGLKDKNGKEIYEGDIVKYKDICSDEYVLQEKSTTGTMNYIESRCSLNPQQIEENTRGGHYIALWDNIIEIEVIGNIYENPELLRKTNEINNQR